MTDLKGVALREVVARKVMGWRRGKVSARDPGPYWDGSFVHRWEDDIGPTKSYWDPTENIEDAVEVLDRLVVLGFSWEAGADSSGFGITIGPEKDNWWVTLDSSEPGTPGEKICRAAINVVGHKKRAPR